MTLVDEFFVHTVTVETCSGRGPYGQTYLTATSVRCYVEAAQDVTVGGTTLAVRDVTKIFAALAYAPDATPTAGQFAPNSRVTVNGEVTEVVNVKRFSSGGLGLPDHIEVTVQ